MNKTIIAFLIAVMLPPLAVCGEEEAVSPVEGTVYVIPIRDMIEPALLYVIRRGVQEAEDRNASAIIFVMDTPGGTLDAAGKIVRTIQDITVPTITLVEKDAYSAGAIIALATDEIYMAPGSVIGDAMPIMMSPLGGVQEMPEAIEEKMVSGVAAKVRAAAEQGGHNKELAEAMVRRENEFKIGEEVISPEGELLTLTNVEAERSYDESGLPLLSAGTVKDLDELLAIKGLEGGEVKELQVTAAERIARFIAGLAPLFLMAGLLGIYIEIKTPGFGLPGILGGLCLILFFWGHHIAGLAGMEDLVIFLFGVVLLLIEVLVIPGFGITGILGLLMIGWAVLNSMAEKFPGDPWYPSWESLKIPLIKVSFSFAAAFVIALILARYLPKTSVFRRLALAGTTSRAAGYTASEDTSGCVGMIGVAESPLRPGGTGMFGDQRLDVITQGDYIDAGKRIQVVETHGSRIIVEELGTRA